MTEVGDGDVPGDYSPKDGLDEGLDVCPHCDTQLGGETGYHGPVVKADGTRYENIYDTDPTDRPFFCPDCYPDLEATRRAREHKTFDEFLDA